MLIIEEHYCLNNIQYLGKPHLSPAWLPAKTELHVYQSVRVLYLYCVCVCVSAGTTTKDVLSILTGVYKSVCLRTDCVNMITQQQWNIQSGNVTVMKN